MKTISENDLPQGSDAWHEWRLLGIGGSEIASVLGISPYFTAYQLWEFKLGIKKRDDSYNFIFEKGHRLEPKIRAMYEIQSGNLATPALVVREDNPSHRASLDGRDAEKLITVEMKFVGSGDKWLLAQEGKAPPEYYAQMQWQLYITGDSYCDYVPYNEKEDKILIVRFYPDIPFIKDMVKQAIAFWKLVTDKIEPELSIRDYKKITDKSLGSDITRYKLLKKRQSKLETELKELADKIKSSELLSHPRTICRGARVITITKKGSIDFKKIVAEHLPEFDTSGYVKASTTYRSIKL